MCICRTNRTKIPGRHHARLFTFGKTQSLLNSWKVQAPADWPGGLLCAFRQVPAPRKFCSVVRTGTTYTFWSPYCVKNIVEIKKTEQSANSMAPVIEELSFSQNGKKTKVYLKKEGTWPDEASKGRGRVNIHLNVM